MQMNRKRMQYTPDDPDKFTLQEMTEKTEVICECNRPRGVEIAAISNRYEEKELIVGGSMLCKIACDSDIDVHQYLRDIV